jgi:uncharacterized protein (TIGR03000 family)
MIRRFFLYGGPLLAVAGLLLTPAPGQAQRFGGGYRGGYGGYYGGYGGYGGSYYPGYSYGWGGAYTPNYSYGWGGYAPGYSYYPGTTYSYPTTSYYYPRSTYYPSSAYYPYYGTNLITDNPASTSTSQSFYPPQENANEQVAYVRVEVPQDADVIFEGQRTEKTQQGGSDRLFVTPPLQKDRNYYYDVKARWMDNGKEVERTRRVNVHAGDNAVVNFMDESK